MQAVTCLDRNYSPFLNECSWQLAMQWSLVVAASDERIHPGMFSKKHVRTKGKGQGSVWVLSWSRKACTILAVWEPAPSHSSSHHRPGTITHLCSMRFPPSSIRWETFSDGHARLQQQQLRTSVSHMVALMKKPVHTPSLCILKPLDCKCSKLNLFWVFFLQIIWLKPINYNQYLLTEHVWIF